MSVSDAETIWMSRIDMNIPNTMMRKAIRRRGAMRSDAAAVIIGEATVASAIIGSIGIGHEPGAARLRHYFGWIIIGESRSASLSASLAPSAVSTVA